MISEVDSPDKSGNVPVPELPGETSSGNEVAALPVVDEENNNRKDEDTSGMYKMRMQNVDVFSEDPDDEKIVIKEVTSWGSECCIIILSFLVIAMAGAGGFFIWLNARNISKNDPTS